MVLLRNPRVGGRMMLEQIAGGELEAYHQDRADHDQGLDVCQGSGFRIICHVRKQMALGLLATSAGHLV
jgi:hypothetical protein